MKEDKSSNTENSPVGHKRQKMKKLYVCKRIQEKIFVPVMTNDKNFNKRLAKS